jgi:hypothetical protein
MPLSVRGYADERPLGNFGGAGRPCPTGNANIRSSAHPRSARLARAPWSACERDWAPAGSFP